MKKILSKFNDPNFNIKFHYCLMIFFILMIPVSVTLLANSVPYLVDERMGIDRGSLVGSYGKSWRNK